MKLVFRGHDERYVVEQSLMNLFPGELPVYEPITPGDDSWAVISLEETGDLCRVAVSLCRGGKTTEQTYQEPLSGGDFQREGLRRHAVGACFFLAARAVTGVTPPWGMLTGVRPDKPVTWALEDGKSPEEARAYLEEHYFVTPSRAALALETGCGIWSGGWRSGTLTCTWAFPSAQPGAPIAPLSASRWSGALPWCPLMWTPCVGRSPPAARWFAGRDCGCGPSTWAAAPPPP